MLQIALTTFLGAIFVVSGAIGISALHDRIAHPPLTVPSENVVPHRPSSQTASAANPSQADTPQSGNIPQSHSATSSQNIKQPESVPTSSDVTASPRAVSKSISQGIVLGASTEAPQPLIVQNAGVTRDELDARIDGLTRSLLSSIGSAAHTETQPIYRSIGDVALQGAENYVSNTGGTLTNATVHGLSGLTDADLPDSLTASNYLPLTGGALTGDLTMSGTLTAGSLSVAGISSSGALVGPYVTATSTTATSTFSGAMGIGTTSPISRLSVSGPGSSPSGTHLIGAIANFTNTTAGVDLVFGGLSSTPYSSWIQTKDSVADNSYFPIALNPLGGNVAIGGTSANGTLSVGGAGAGSGSSKRGIFGYAPGANNLAIEAVENAGVHGIYLRPNTSSANLISSDFLSGSTYLPLALSSRENASDFVLNNGNIGIGQTSPTYKLDVSGLGRFTGLVDAANFVATSTTATSTFSGGLFSNYGAFNRASFGATATSSFSSAGVLSLASALAVSSGGTGQSSFGQGWLNSNGTTISASTSPTVNYLIATSTTATTTLAGMLAVGSNALNVLSNGNVGIGTAVPTQALTVSGSLAFTAAATISTPSSQGTLTINGGSPGGSGASPAVVLQRAGQAILTVDGSNTSYTGGPYAVLITPPSSSNPVKALVVRQNSAGTGNLFEWQNSSGTGLGVIDVSGNVGIGTTTPNGKLTVQVDTNQNISFADSGANSVIGWGLTSLSATPVSPVIYSNDSFLALESKDSDKLYFNFDSAGQVILANGGGNVGVGTTTPWRTLSVTGTVGFDGLTGSTGAGSLCLDSNKQVVYNSASDNCLSSTRATKHAIEGLSLDGLRIIDALQPVSFVYNQGDGRTRYGFIAEDTAAVDAHLATYDASGTVSGIDDRSIIAVLVGALKELAANVRGFTDSFTTKELTFNRATGADMTLTHQLCIEKSDRTPVCVTGDQLSAMLAGSAAGAADTHTEAATGSAPEAAEAAASGQPIIHNSGDSSATTDATSANASSAPAEVGTEDPPISIADDDDQPVQELPATGTE